MHSHRRVFLKQLGLGAAGVGLLPSISRTMADESPSTAKLPRSTPEAQGISSEGILGFLEALAQSSHEFHSFMMLRHGHVVAEGWWRPYEAGLNQMLYSLSKSFTSTAVGFAVTEKKLTTDDAVASFFPGKVPGAVSANLKALRIKDLLTMSVGHAEDSTPVITRTHDWVKTFLSLPIAHPPGTVFLYNSGATYMLSAIVQQVTGDKVIDYLRPRLFEPLGIRGMTWETCPLGINTGGWGLEVPTEALARFGQFYLQEGKWDGRQLLPAAWVREATSFKIQQPANNGASLEELKRTSEWHQGYCYQFWRCRHDAYRGDGAFGQYTIVLPKQDAVIAITSETSSMAGEMNLVWEHLLPAMKDGELPADASAQKRLKNRLLALALEPPKGGHSSPVASKISGKPFKLEPNSLGVEAVTFQFKSGSCEFVAQTGSSRHTIACGLENWIKGVTDMPGTPPKLTLGDLGPTSKVAASGVWSGDDAFVMTWHFYGTPHHDTVTCHFEGDRVRIEFMNSVTQYMAGHKESRPTLEGKLEA